MAVVVSRFPLVTETFILREIDELERRGQPVVLVPLIRENPPVVHPEARPWVDRARYSPFFSPSILGANLRALRRDPAAYLGTLARLIRGNLPSPGFLARSLLLFPKAVDLAERLPRDRVTHLHAHFATHPATVAWIASRLSDLEFSFTAHAHDLFVDSTFLEEKLRSARFVRTISEFNRRWLRERFPGVETGIEVVPMGIDVDRYRAPEAPFVEPPSGEPPVVLCVAALKPYKGIPVLLEACRILRGRGVELRCRVVGEGPERRVLEETIREEGLGERVELLGARTQEEVADLMAEARVVALPSVVAEDGQMEGLPVVLMEASAAERAVVAPAFSGIPELVEDGTSGLLFPPGDPEALADRIQELLEDPEKARRLGRGARDRILESFRLGDTAAGVLRLLDRDNPSERREDRERIEPLIREGERIGVEAIHEGPDARVFEVLLAASDGSRRAILKEHRSRPGESAPPPVRAHRESSVLRELEGLRFRGLPLGAPGVLRAEEERGLLLLERIPGDPLDRLFRRWRLRPSLGALEEMEEVGRRAGAWLRTFQDRVSPPSPTHEPSEAWRIRVEEAIREASDRGWLTPRGRASADGWLGRGAEMLEIGPLVARHGDFWPGNLMVTRRGADAEVGVLDFEGFGAGSPWEDPASFLMQSELFFPPPLGSRFRRLRRGFLEGFGRDLEAGLDLFRAAEALFVLAAGGWRSGLPWPSSWRRRRLLGAIEGDSS
ncbi:MAG: glycosyltransferase [Thermoanaerobaculia bacterium]|nr:glycosyltransferase [Thermoanaerobaculia bacterium]